MNRHEVLVAGAQEVLTMTSRAAAAAGACSFELRYDILNRITKPDEAAQPDDSVRWTAAVTLDSPGGHVTRSGTCRVDPTDNVGHASGIQWACIRLMRELGITVKTTDIYGREEPSR